VKNRKWIVFGGAALALGIAATSSGIARAEDFCDTGGLLVAYQGPAAAPEDQKTEEKVRQKCKVGDLIKPGNTVFIARLCDLQKPWIGSGNNGAVCYLAAPRKTY
jgi:hypothetical protein